MTTEMTWSAVRTSSIAGSSSHHLSRSLTPSLSQAWLDTQHLYLDTYDFLTRKTELTYSIKLIKSVEKKNSVC